MKCKRFWENELVLKITSLDITPLKNRGLLLRVHTDEGLIGYGSPMNYEHGRTVERALLDMADYLVGRDPRQIEDHWQVLFRSSYSRQMPILLSALSGLEMACLDILGKSLGAPVWRLLGGTVRDRIRVYSGIGGPEPGQYADNARVAVERGFTAVKMTPFPDPVRYIDTPAVADRIVARVEATREAVGPDIDIAIDFHRAVSPAMAKILLKELEPIRPLFVEEPTHPENVDALLEMKKIAALAEVHYLAMAPHSAADAVGVVAALHAMAGTPNFLIQEFGGGTGEGLFTEPLTLEDGFVAIPQGPGLGFEIDPDGLEALRLRDWRLRSMRRHPEDNSINDI